MLKDKPWVALPQYYDTKIFVNVTPATIRKRLDNH